MRGSRIQQNLLLSGNSGLCLTAGLGESEICGSNALVAQLDRAPDYGSGGWGFESSRARHPLMALLFPLRPPASPQERDQRIMELALREAQLAADRDEVPVGAVVVRGNEILARAGNRVEELKDATAHAEMLALTSAFEAAGEKRLVDAELFVTLEPCIQCAGAILHARLARVVFGATDPKFGGVVSLTQIFELDGLNHRVLHEGGLFADESASLLRDFFRAKRKASPS
jgi:tRNA(adenine34) deaminase